MDEIKSIHTSLHHTHNAMHAIIGELEKLQEQIDVRINALEVAHSLHCHNMYKRLDELEIVVVSIGIGYESPKKLLLKARSCAKELEKKWCKEFPDEQ